MVDRPSAQRDPCDCFLKLSTFTRPSFAANGAAVAMLEQNVAKTAKHIKM
jgi:hypothetical protein